ncbi:MAG TPA: DUF1854 domain-containing protein [bacterium]|nr:DUF1854 domain-containing protein [bacterium]HOL49400.1 DUF1854 domain-containing protein [bacterium]HPO52333.1 DUF1854 domain-containing protein [bacterium]
MGEDIKKPEIVFLDPKKIKIFRGTFETIHLMLEDGSLYRGVFAVAAFPVSNPNKYISLFCYDERDREYEIGMIEDIEPLPEEAKKLIVDALKRQYFSFEILAINSIKFAYGLLFFDVETDKGPREFSMKWETRFAFDFGRKGKILVDIFEDRYVIRDISKLNKIEQELFTRYIYW